MVNKYPARRSQIMRGWGKPIIQRLADGTLLASQYLKTNPGTESRREKAALCASVDDGLSWSKPRLLGINGRITQFSILHDDSMILAVDDYHGRTSGIYRSTDSGESWTEAEIKWDDFVKNTDGSEYRGIGETSGILELPDGMLLGSCYILGDKRDEHCYIIRSQDRGKTWSDASFMTNTEEANLLLMPDSGIIAFVRLSYAISKKLLGTTSGNPHKEGGDVMAFMESRDYGYTWSLPRILELGAAQVPAFPLLLPDGRLLLLYGNRQFPFSVQAVCSLDNGHSWNWDNPELTHIKSYRRRHDKGGAWGVVDSY